MDSITKRLADYLPTHGSMTAKVEDLDLPVDLWRKAARAAGRILSRPIRTRLAYGYVEARIADWPADDAERELERVEAHRRAAVMDALIFGPRGADGQPIKED